MALATKLAEVELIGERIGEPPVLLLDDAGSELDEARQVVDILSALIRDFLVQPTPAH